MATSEAAHLRSKLHALENDLSEIESDLGHISDKIALMEIDIDSLSDGDDGDLVAVDRRLLWDVLDELQRGGITGPLHDRLYAAVWGEIDA